MIELFDGSLTRFETMLEAGISIFEAYSEAMAFLDTIYLFSRMLLDSVAGIIRHFYKYNESRELPKSFDDMFKKSHRGELPDNLNTVFS